MKAQSLIIASFFLSIIIIALALTNTRIYIHVLENDEITKHATLFSFYTSSLAYATNKSFYEILNYSEDPSIGFNAMKKAKEFAEEYYIQSVLKAKEIMPNSWFSNFPNVTFMMMSNKLKGNGSSFIILVYNEEKLLANITAYIIQASIKPANTSIGVYYVVSIYVSSLYFIQNDLKIKEENYNVMVFSNKKSIDFISYKKGDIITIIVDSTYEKKLLIEIINQQDIVIWLFA